ncbi:hypothetical protein PIB30_033247 [Stylosanthes scabra]|uniref:Transposase MuDR plant domain-containing protein n=1 Tax=Stylosanthes scabra TaxID=79078 RepID=A0ABU6WEJ0_9FABA|nr:hypothetical protein [Stylosanthes scabra]
MNFLVEVGKICSPCAPPIAATPVHIAEPSVPDVEMKMDNTESESDYVPTSESPSDGPVDDEHIPDNPAIGHPIPRLADVPCFFQQLHLDEIAIVDPLKVDLADDYNTDGGAEFRVGDRMRSREVVHTAVKNYSIQKNAKYMVVESDRIKYHCRWGS